MPRNSAEQDRVWMQRALALARRGYGATSPNPMVGAVLVRNSQRLAQGWHHQAGQPHAEIEALLDAQRHRRSSRGATLYVTLEPCCTHGRTPPCTDAIIAAGIGRVVVGAIDPNPAHSGHGLKLLEQAGIQVDRGILADEATRLNEAFNHWIVHRTPFVTVKAAMTLDGKIATAQGESKWITSTAARTRGMHERAGADAVLVGIQTILADDPSLTFRPPPHPSRQAPAPVHLLRRIILDSEARTPLQSRVVSDAQSDLTTIVVTRRASVRRIRALQRHVAVVVAPRRRDGIDLKWLLRRLGTENVTHLLVEGGGEVNASFLLGGLAQRILFFYAPKILGGRSARRAVAGTGIRSEKEVIHLQEVEWDKAGPDLLLTARLGR